MKKNDTYIKLYSCCIPVKGINRTAVCDLQRSRVYFIPNALFELFNNKDNAFNLTELKNNLNKANANVLEEYLDFLDKNELAFEVQAYELSQFPLLDTNYLFPAHISNCIIDSVGVISYLDAGFMKQLEVLCCNYLQIRYLEKISCDMLQDILDFLNPTQVKSIEILLNYPNEIDFDKRIVQIVQQNKKVKNISIYNASKRGIIEMEDKELGTIYMTEENIIPHLHCGIVQIEQFAINVPHYTESLHHNTCLNRKIAIDTEGNIKNCPSMKESFGNIRDTTLEEAVNKPGFKKYWNIKKDEISKCKDCEFRYICTDCRAYLENPEDIYSAPLKCGYNPYTCEWDVWNANPLKQKAIEYYELS